MHIREIEIKPFPEFNEKISFDSDSKDGDVFDFDSLEGVSVLEVIGLHETGEFEVTEEGHREVERILC